jgi:hypothetical protein
MATDIAKELARLDYDEDEVQRRQQLVTADLNRYIQRNTRS